MAFETIVNKLFVRNQAGVHGQPLPSGGHGRRRSAVLSCLALLVSAAAFAVYPVRPHPRGVALALSNVEVGAPKIAGDSFTLALLPDTQYYSLRYPEIFAMQTQWLARTANAIDLRYVIHLGDIVHRNTAPEWQNAAAAMAALDDRVPYVLTTGNHDYGPRGTARSRETLLNDYFDFGEHARRPSFAGAYEAGKLDNTYHLFNAGGHDWIILSLEWGPRDEVVAWANEVMRTHSDRLGIFVTHAYLYHTSQRYDHTKPELGQRWNPHDYPTPGGVNDGEELWQKLLRHHRFVISVNGHVSGKGTGYLRSRTDLGNWCHQMLSNYQMRTLGGEGYLRLLEFKARGGRVEVHSYSPLRNARLVAGNHRFGFDLQ